MFTSISNTPSEFKNNTIIFISFNQSLIKIETVQQSNNIKSKSSNESSMNLALQTIEIFVSFNASNIILERMKCNKKN